MSLNLKEINDEKILEGAIMALDCVSKLKTVNPIPAEVFVMLWDAMKRLQQVKEGGKNDV